MDKTIIKNIIKGTSSTTISTVTSTFFNFLSIYLFTHYITKDEFGIYALIIVISSLLNLISGLGLEISVVKYLSDESNYKEFILIPVLIIKIIFMSFVIIIFLLFSRYYSFGNEINVWDYKTFILVLFILGNFRDFFYRVLQGLNIFNHYAKIQISSAIIRVLFLISIIFFYKLTLSNILLVEVIVVSNTLLLQFFYIPFKSILKYQKKSGMTKDILKFTSPLYANNLMTFAYDRVGLLIIGMFMSASNVAIYNVSEKIPQALSGIYNSFIIVFFPNISTLFSKRDHKNASDLMNHSLQIISLFLSFLILIIIFLKDIIIKLLFSITYANSAIPLAFLLIGFVVRSLSNILGYSIVSAGYSKITMKVSLISMSFGLLSTFILVWQFGYIGAALSVVMLNLVSLFQNSYYVFKLKLAVIKHSYLKPIYTVIGIVLFIAIFNINNVFINISIFILFIIFNYNTIIRYIYHFKSLKLKNP